MANELDHRDNQPCPTEWEIEEIPNADILYYRVHKNDWNPDGTPKEGAFRNSPNKQTSGMSTNWSKYSTAGQALEGTRKPKEEYGVVALNVAAVRAIPDQEIKHSPDRDSVNRSHTDVFGRKDPETRLGYMDAYAVAIPVPAKE